MILSSVCLFVCPSVCDEMYCGQTIHSTAKVTVHCTSEYEVLHRNTMFQLSTHYTDPIPLKNSPPLEPQTLMPSGKWIKHTLNKRTAIISTSGIAVVSMLHGYSRQRRTIGSFSATAAGLLVFLSLKCHVVVDDVGDHEDTSAICLL